MIRAGTVLGAAAMLAVATAASAQRDTRFSADVSATAGYQNNPFTLYGGDTGAGVVTVDVAPKYELLMPRSTITVSADANLQQYLSKYGHNDSYAGAVDYQGRPGEHTTTHLRLDVSSAVLGSYTDNSFLNGSTLFTPASGDSAGAGATGGAAPVDTGALQPITVPPLSPLTDVGLYGTRSRRRAVDLAGDVGFTLSSRDTVDISGYGQVSRYSTAVNDVFNGDYEAFGGAFAWQRRLTSRLSAGLTGSASTYNYHGDNPDSQVGSVQATASFQLNEHWRGDGAIGVSFVSGGGVYSTHSTSLSGNINLCNRDAHSQTCLQAGRQVEPTGFAGSQYVTSAGLTHTRQLDERQNLSLGVTYSKVGGADQPVLTAYRFDNEYIQASAGYNRRLGTRLSLVASTNYRKLLGNNNAGRSADYGGQVGLSYRFGDRR